MEATIVRGGKFTFTISQDELARGLRTTKRAGRNKEYLVTCVGAVGRDGVLQVIDKLARIASDGITDAFPFPQLFVLSNLVLVCGSTKIYEYADGALTLKYTATTGGGLWSIADFFDYLYLSNGYEAVVRDAGSKAYSLTTDFPTATAICNYNGQVLIGAPDMNGLAANLTIDATAITVTAAELEVGVK